MRKLLLMIVTLSLGTFALAQGAGGNSGFDNTQGAGNDWYNQHLSAQVQQFGRIAAATAPSTSSEAQGAQPASMTANAGEGAGQDWYSQKLAAQVQEFELINAAVAPSIAQTAVQPAQ